MQRLIEGAGELNITLTPVQIEQFKIYYRELIDWNGRVNLTSITGYEEVQVRHFLDSLTVTLAVKILLTESYSVMDVGTGAGLPGLPLKIVLPGTRLVLLEATGKKAAFLDHIVSRLELDDVQIVARRAETAAHEPSYREQFDLVLSRGVAGLATLAELTLPFCKIGGRVIAQKKGDITRELDEAAGAIGMLGGQLSGAKPVELAGLADGRSLVVIDKVAQSPARYPRRPGIPAKRPLSGN